MSDRKHHYEIGLIWDGNRGDGTSDYRTYGRNHRIIGKGKPELQATADVAFRGEAGKYNPEDLLTAAASSCHMLSYLALCAREHISVVAYEDDATGVMEEDGRGGGKFTQIVLRPTVTIADAAHRDRAEALHERAHELCYIASSINCEIVLGITIKIADGRT